MKPFETILVDDALLDNEEHLADGPAAVACASDMMPLGG